jgi:hypothetical protein
MGRSGSVYRRCTGCRRRIAGARCECGHGRFTWTFTVDVALSGATTRRQIKRGGFVRKQDALEAMQSELVDRRRETRIPMTNVSFGEYATAWLQERARVRVALGQLAETTFAIYERDLRNHLVPDLGEIPLQQLDGPTLTRHYSKLLEHLATKTIANVHAVTGVLTLADFYGDEQAAQAAADTAWLADAAGDDLVILTRDGNLYVHEHERLALERYAHRVFWIGPKKGTGQDWADTFEAHHQAIARYALQPGPFVVKVQRGGLQRAWP